MNGRNSEGSEGRNSEGNEFSKGWPRRDSKKNEKRMKDKKISDVSWTTLSMLLPI